jgi:hypothetical protein
MIMIGLLALAMASIVMPIDEAIEARRLRRKFDSLGWIREREAPFKPLDLERYQMATHRGGYAP